MKKLLPVSLILLASTTPTIAAENEVHTVESKGYIAGAVGTTSADDYDNATGFEVIGGYNLNESVALEASYVDFGSADHDYAYDAEVGVTALTAGVVGSIELAPKFSLMAKVGFSAWEAELTSNYWGDDDDGTGIFFGFGGEYKITEKVSLGARYTTYDMDGDDVTMAAATIKIAL